ncbi:MAG: rhodanese-like domain-containing protein [Candidatus Dormibacteria bacterium]
MPPAADATPAQAAEAVASGSALLIDVREPWEWEERRIPGATLIPLAELSERLDDVPGDREVYVHCRLGGRSARAVEFLHSHGRPRAVNVAGGIEQWIKDGLPTEP